MATGTLLTIDDYEGLPAEQAENHELIEGELIPVSANNPNHNWLRDLLVQVLATYLGRNPIGRVITEQEFDFGGDALAPDISFFRADKLPMVNRDQRVQRFVPDLAIEIASPSDTYGSLLRKKDRYMRYGTSEVWIFSIEAREVSVYSSSRNFILTERDALTTDLLPGLEIQIGQLLDKL